MIKDEIPRGQLSTIILMTLLERDKYGYEIIDEVLHNTSGKVSIKQPSLYSSLKRMEEQTLISSYWRDSEIGGKRHYYHLTDLGKKHLEKWKNDVSEQYYKSQDNEVVEQSNSFENTKVLQQQNLFNLEKETTSKQENSFEENKKDDAFVQFDLFSNSVILTPPSNDDKDNVNENYYNSQIENNSSENIISPQPMPINQNPILTSYEKPLEEKSYNFEYVKKTNKSFSESLNSATYEKKYIETENKAYPVKNNEVVFKKETDISKESDNYSLPINNIKLDELQETNEEITVQDNTTNILLPNDDITSETDENNNNICKVDIKELKNYMPNKNLLSTSSDDNETNSKQDEINKEKQNKANEKTDDGVFITERLNPEDMPKPTKWDTRRFEYYISANNVTPDLKRNNKNSNYEDRVKDLYEQSKQNAENQELELIDNKVKFSTYKDLQEFYKEQNIKFKPFEKSLKKTNKDYNMIKINKLNMLTALSVFVYTIIISMIFGIAYSFVSGVRFNKPISFIIMPILVGIYFCYYLICYIKTPQKRIALDISKYKLKPKYIWASVLLIPLILSGNLIAGFTFANISMYQIAIFYPLCFVFTYFVYFVARKLILKTKSIY